MALSPGPAFHPNSMGREWELAAHLLPFSVTEETRRRGARTGDHGHEARLQGRGRGSGPAPLPLLFGSASSQATPRSSCWHIPWRGGGCKPRDQRLQPRPIMWGSPLSIVPRGWGRGVAIGDQPRPTRCVAESLGGRPCLPRGIPTLAVTTPTPQRTAGRGSQTYRDVRDALLALVRHGPSGALSPRVDQGAVFSSARLSLGRAPGGRGDKAREE